jgi:hypothetical protein
MKGSGMPIKIPVVDMVEIGAGGGSLARVDELGRVTVGPDSAGADPGPACYGQGGRGAAVTCCWDDSTPTILRADICLLILKLRTMLCIRL